MLTDKVIKAGVRVATLDRTTITGELTGRTRVRNGRLLVQVHQDPFKEPNANGEYVRLYSWIPADQLVIL